eukprot:jgi/Chlat1/2930/Chrsp2S00362
MAAPAARFGTFDRAAHGPRADWLGNLQAISRSKNVAKARADGPYITHEANRRKLQGSAAVSVVNDSTLKWLAFMRVQTHLGRLANERSSSGVDASGGQGLRVIKLTEVSPRSDAHARRLALLQTMLAHPQPCFCDPRVWHELLAHDHLHGRDEFNFVAKLVFGFRTLDEAAVAIENNSVTIVRPLF